MNERNTFSIWITRSYPRSALNVRGCNLFINLSPPLWRREGGRKCSLHVGFSSFFLLSLSLFFFRQMLSPPWWIVECGNGWMWRMVIHTHTVFHTVENFKALFLPSTSFLPHSLLSNSLISLNILSITFQFALSPRRFIAHTSIHAPLQVVFTKLDVEGHATFTRNIRKWR